jgi:hypothetical protein
MAEVDGEADPAVEAAFVSQRLRHTDRLLDEVRRGIEGVLADDEDASADEARRIRIQLREVGDELRALQRIVSPDDGAVASMPSQQHLELLHEIAGMRARADRLRREVRRTDGLSNQSIIVTGGGAVTINSGANAQSVQGEPPPVPFLPEQEPTSSSRRAEFVYGSYEDQRKEAKITFWLSLAVASVAAIFALSAAGLALFQDGAQSGKWVTTFVSTAVAIAGGVWHRRARDTRAEVSGHVKRVEKKVEADDHYEKTNARIDRIQDPQMRDRLNAAATIADLGFQADPDTITDRVIGSSSAAVELPPAIESADERRDPEGRTDG